jgi:hypothetical protein
MAKLAEVVHAAHVLHTGADVTQPSLLAIHHCVLTYIMCLFAVLLVLFIDVPKNEHLVAGHRSELIKDPYW